MGTLLIRTSIWSMDKYIILNAGGVIIFQALVTYLIHAHDAKYQFDIINIRLVNETNL